MKFTRLISACAAAAALTVALFPVMANTYTKTNIPFEFVASGKVMPAGEYLFSKNSSSVLTIRHENGEAALSMSTRHVGKVSGASDAKTVFVKKDGRMHLQEIHLSGQPGGEQISVK